MIGHDENIQLDLFDSELVLIFHYNNFDLCISLASYLMCIVSCEDIIVGMSATSLHKLSIHCV